MINAAIFYLTQNTETKKIYLKTSLYFLFKNFNEKYKYPVIIFHEGDYDSKAQTDIIMSIRKSCRSLISFRALDKDDFTIPSHIDINKMKSCIDTKPAAYWRNEQYRMMCRWWIVHFPKYAKDYDYVMRLDDDSIIEEPISDLFDWLKNKNLVYTSNMLHVDCGICCYGMRDFMINYFKTENYKSKIDKLFLEHDLPMNNFMMHPFRLLLSITQDPLPDIKETMKIYSPIMYYNNFFITKTDFWQRKDVQDLIQEIDKDGSIFYFRWGDAPLQSLIIMLLAGEDKVDRCIFKYSKRMQRESFFGNDNNYHSYMPEKYTQTSCIINDEVKL
jgi:alpha 1,2-mannosyltransferase